MTAVAPPHEYSNKLSKLYHESKIPAAVLLLGLLIAGLSLSLTAFAIELALIGSVALWEYLLSTMRPVRRTAADNYNKTKRQLRAISLLMPVVAVGGLYGVYAFAAAGEQGLYLLLVVIVAICMCDVGAQVVGRACSGRFISATPFRITSPNKTWEGLIGGYVTGVGASLICAVQLPKIWIGDSSPAILVLCVLVPVAGIFGDYYESFTKRIIEIKDYSRNLGAHGGVLDRIDAICMGVIFAQVYCALLQI